MTFLEWMEACDVKYEFEYDYTSDMYGFGIKNIRYYHGTDDCLGWDTYMEAKAIGHTIDSAINVCMKKIMGNKILIVDNDEKGKKHVKAPENMNITTLVKKIKKSSKYVIAQLGSV